MLLALKLGIAGHATALNLQIGTRCILLVERGSRRLSLP
jgi:hypothetical protein